MTFHVSFCISRFFKLLFLNTQNGILQTKVSRKPFRAFNVAADRDLLAIKKTVNGWDGQGVRLCR